MLSSWYQTSIWFPLSYAAELRMFCLMNSGVFCYSNCTIVPRGHTPWICSGGRMTTLHATVIKIHCLVKSSHHQVRIFKSYPRAYYNHLVT